MSKYHIVGNPMSQLIKEDQSSICEANVQQACLSMALLETPKIDFLALRPI